MRTQDGEGLRGLVVLMIRIGILISAGVFAEGTKPAGFHTRSMPAGEDRQWILYEDDAVRMVAVDHGNADRQSIPGFFILRKDRGEWIRIEKISTAGARFGRNPTMEEVAQTGAIPPSIGWDFRDLAERMYVDFPLAWGGFLFFPDAVERVNDGGRYVLRFNSGWGIEPVETVIPLQSDDLREIDIPGTTPADPDLSEIPEISDD